MSSHAKVWAEPHTTKATALVRRPIVRMRQWPKRSASRPQPSSRLA